MYKNEIILSTKEILEKEFKLDTRGYRPQEVDKFLDIIIHDYDAYKDKVHDLEQDKKELVEDNIRLKQEIRNLKTKIEVLQEEKPGNDITNADLLRRLSNLEKIIYGKE